MNQFLLMPWLLMVGSAYCNCAGSLLLKQSRLVTVNSSFWATLISPWFFTALVIYSTGLLLFAKALDHLPVSIAVPCSTGLGFLLVTVLSHYLFAERLAITQLVALSLILGGVIAATRS
ncbi:small multidrug resistance protein [Oscillatoria sp. FACHB-1407]|uniref:DMT family transporter n=1 Tax=Oscillatoria sp. FACHB-1407 TaxID=2692847 RepID=UPI0016863330|nr:SMR family transporter [Oscillatoria sp. FACHB-1407]MBD2463123.1 small multidrug resistance protein [Oscillatoria sp. FACHB-1407]